MLLNRSASRWVGLLLGLFVCSLPLVALATEFKPPRRGLPGRREGGGTRDPLACLQGSPSQLTALMPQTNLGLTTAEYPRFFWYVPKTSAKSAEFVLYQVTQDTDDAMPIYTKTFNLTGAPGITSLMLSDHAALPPLTAGKDYRWSMSIICNPNDRKRDIRVTGWVQRIVPDSALAGKLNRANADDRVALYATNGIWFDTLSTLADLRCARPQDPTLTANWVTLLKSVKLDAIADQPLQHCDNS